MRKKIRSGNNIVCLVLMYLFMAFVVFISLAPPVWAFFIFLDVDPMYVTVLV